MKKSYIGVDYSMTSPSLTIITDDKVKSYFLTTKAKLLGELQISQNYTIIGIEYPDHTSDVDRFNKLAKIMLKFIPNPSECDIAIEGYSFGSTGSRIFQIGENGGVLKNILYENGYTFITFAPKEVKKHATENGNASKDQMFDAFIRETGLSETYLRQTFNQQKEIKSPLADITDSYLIALMLKSKS